jgi:hypothetical protein
MSMTKTQNWDAICAMTEGFDEAQYWLMPYQLVDETEINWFSDSRLAHDGYQEFECQLCGGFNDVDFPHSACHEQERAWAELADSDLPF